MRGIRNGCGALAACALIWTTAAPAAAAPPERARLQGDEGASRSHDARAGKRRATDRQRDLADRPGLRVRFNRLGTPSVVTSDTGPVDVGLPASPTAAARAFLRGNRELFGLSSRAVEGLEVVNVAPLGDGAAVLLRQRFGGLRAGLDGLVAVGVRDGAAYFASSSLTRDDASPGAARVSDRSAIAAAARNAGRDARSVERRADRGGWRTYDVRGLDQPVRVRTVAVPTPEDGVRRAFEVLVMDADAADPLGFQTYVDARTGRVLSRVEIVDSLADNARFLVFPNVPPLDYASRDTRGLWCWTATAGCERAVASAASPLEWDRNPSGAVTRRTRGNNARGTEKWDSNSSREPGKNYTEAPDREFVFPWTNQWLEERCNPEVFESRRRNDIDASTSNLFAMHNRMHDWSYRLGFTESTWNLQESNFGRGGADGDPEHGNAQAGGVVGGPPGYASRDNANQFTPPDGVLPITNMYLWQPIPAGFYSPCVDGDFDMSVIGHEYTHAISNRMVAGPDQRLLGLQANAMGESWSDTMAVEYLAEHGFAPVAGENPFAVGPYVTGDGVAGIRNYAMDRSPLNYSDVGYDLVGPQVHADGEIWSATNFDIRRAFNAAYDARFPSSDARLQDDCAEGRTPVTGCPGNRRWVQLVFDAWLLMASGGVSMVDARDALLAADRIRFGGGHQALLWNAFAARGLGQEAASAGAEDHQPTPGFSSPHLAEGTLTLAGGPGAAPDAQLFVGRYEGRVTPVADTDPDTALDERVRLVPGTYELVLRADGHGATRMTIAVVAGEEQVLSTVLPRNLASAANGATASGDGVNLGKLIDDTEATNWAYLGLDTVRGRQVTVRLDPSRPGARIRRIQVSALLRPRDPEDPGGDVGGQNRFSALRSFQLLACDATGGSDCADDADFGLVFTSPPDAFPAVRPRPRSPDLALRSFTVPRTRATHLRLRVLDNQCTGGPDYAGDQDDDPRHQTDCVAGSGQDAIVRAAELQAFER